MSWKIGTIAKKTGLTIRSIRFYEEVGLINPLRDNQSGHRLYMTQDLIKLQQIKSLSHLGLPLSRIKSILDNMTSNDWLKLINEQINYIQKQKSSLDLILLQLTNLKNKITNSDMDKKSINNILFSTLEAITMYDKYFDKETINSFHNHNHIDQNGKVTTIDESWRNWCQSLNDLMKNNISPQDDHAKELMKHWNQMINHINENDPEKVKAFNELIHNEPQARLDHGITAEMFEYMSKALNNHK